MSPWLKILALVGLVAAAFGAGWHAKSVSVEAATARGAQQELKQVTTDFSQQITDHTAKLQEQQDQSASLFAQQQMVRAAGADIRLEITDAVFTPATTSGSAPACPDPSGSAEFERLYAAAAKGGDPAHSGTASTGGVP